MTGTLAVDAGFSVAHAEKTVVGYSPRGSLVWEYSPGAADVCQEPVCQETALEEAIVLVMIHVMPRTRCPVHPVYLSEGTLVGSRPETEVGWGPAEETAAASAQGAHI